jgi:hypothetical protein
MGIVRLRVIIVGANERALWSTILLTQAAGFPTVVRWLKRSLQWLPTEFVGHYSVYGL